VLQAATFAILLIACANLANLLLGAGAGRSSEIVVRTALGARRTRIVRQLLTESLVLAAAGGAGGLLLAWWSTAWLSHAASHMLLPGQTLHLDLGVLTFATVLTLAVGVVFGLVPAVQVSRMTVADAGRRHTAGPAGGHLRSALIAAEVALSVLLLASAVLLIRSFERLTHVDPGFRAPQVLTFQLAIPAAMYQGRTPATVYERLYDRLRRLPGIDAVAGVNILPLSGNYSCDGMQIEGHEVPPGQTPCAEVRSVSVDYFRALGIPLQRGRLFTMNDNERSKHVILINEALARRYFPGEDPIGRRIVYASRLQNDPREIVGVIGDVHHFGLDAAPTPEFYTPELQPPTYGSMTVVLHGEGDPVATIPAVRAVVRQFAPNVPVYNVRTLAQLIDASTGTVRTRTVLLGLFAALALVLALVGTYGVVSIVVSQRVREIGIRLALGASPRDILKLIVGGGLKPILTGGVAGLAGAIVAGRVLGGLLFHVSPADPLTFGSTVATVLVTGFVATWIPARRASRVDPVSALRVE
jgi:putative ABC transport system permease protein